MNLKMKQLKKEKRNTEAKRELSVQHNLSTLNVQIFSHPSSKTTLLSTSVDLLKTDIQQQTPTT